MNAEQIGERLQQLRLDAGMSQTDLADRSGVPRASIRNYEHGRRMLSYAQAMRLAKALGVDVGAFSHKPVARKGRPAHMKSGPKSKKDAC